MQLLYMSVSLLLVINRRILISQYFYEWLKVYGLKTEEKESISVVRDRGGAGGGAMSIINMCVGCGVLSGKTFETIFRNLETEACHSLFCCQT